MNSFAEKVYSDPILRDWRGQLRQLQRNSIRIKNLGHSVGKERLGNSRFGGLPDAPPGFAWPTHRIEAPTPSQAFVDASRDSISLLPSDGVVSLQFVAQINLSQVAPFDEEGVLPKSGLLLFFYQDELFEVDVPALSGKTYEEPQSLADMFKQVERRLAEPEPDWELTPKFIDGKAFQTRLHGFDYFKQCRVLYVEETNQLQPVSAAPSNISHRPWLNSIFNEVVCEFSKEPTLPGPDDFVFAERPSPEARPAGRIQMSSEAHKRYGKLHYECRATGNINQMLGWPDVFSHSAMVTKDPNRPRDWWQNLSADQRLNECMDTRLLLQISLPLQDDCGMSFGRDLFFMSRDSDLKRRDFSKVWWDME